MENRQPLAVVGTRTITEADVNQAILSLGPRAETYNNPQGRAAILEQLIEQALFLAEARKNMMEYDPEFKAQLTRVKEDLLVQFAIAKALERVNVTEDEIRKFYDENPDQFAGGETVRASHILVSDEGKAGELLEKINAGEISFEDAAAQFSSCPSSQKGGDLGEFGRGQMVPEFDEACFDMNVGELRGPIKTQFGFHLIKLTDKKAAEKITLVQAHDAIKQHLMGEKQQKTYRTKVNQLKIMYPVNR